MRKTSYTTLTMSAPKATNVKKRKQDVHKTPMGRYALTVFYAENYDVHTNNGADTITPPPPTPGNRAGLPRSLDPVPLNLHRGDSFVPYSDLVHASGAVPLSPLSHSWRKVGFLHFAHF